MQRRTGLFCFPITLAQFHYLSSASLCVSIRRRKGKERLTYAGSSPSSSPRRRPLRSVEARSCTRCCEFFAADQLGADSLGWRMPRLFRSISTLASTLSKPLKEANKKGGKREEKDEQDATFSNSICAEADEAMRARAAIVVEKSIFAGWNWYRI